MFYAYVVKNSKELFYKGSTENLSNRIGQHNSGEFPGYTKSRGPWTLVYNESFTTRKEAEARERFFKTGTGRRFLKGVIK